MKTKKLKYSPDYEFSIIGIISGEDDYKVSWLINKLCGIDLYKQKNLEIRNDKYSNFQVFSVFKAFLEDSGNRLRFLSNKCSDGFLIEELKNIDYLLVIYGDNRENLLNKIIKELKPGSEINGVFKIDPNKLKSREKLLF